MRYLILLLFVHSFIFCIDFNIGNTYKIEYSQFSNSKSHKEYLYVKLLDKTNVFIYTPYYLAEYRASDINPKEFFGIWSYNTNNLIISVFDSNNIIIGTPYGSTANFEINICLTNKHYTGNFIIDKHSHKLYFNIYRVNHFKTNNRLLNTKIFSFDNNINNIFEYRSLSNANNNILFNKFILIKPINTIGGTYQFQYSFVSQTNIYYYYNKDNVIELLLPNRLPALDDGYFILYPLSLSNGTYTVNGISVYSGGGPLYYENEFIIIITNYN